MSEGEPLTAISRDLGFHWTTWRVWCREDESLNIAHMRARDEGYDAIAFDVLDIIDAEPERVVSMMGDDKVETRIDSAAVAWQKNRAEMRLKLLAKWDPRRYGDKLAVGGADDLPAIRNETVTLDSVITHVSSLTGADRDTALRGIAGSGKETVQ